MKKRHLFLVLLAGVALVLLACPNPTLQKSSPPPSTPAPSTTSPTPGGGSVTLQVVNDTARDQGVLVTSSGSRIDIKAVADNGSTVNCTDASGLAALSDNSGSTVIIGTKGDGNPGAWEYLSGKIQCVIDEDSGALTSSLPPTNDQDGSFRGPFGWTYHVMGVSGDGKIIIGYAENKKGFTKGPFKIDPGTTVGVYWRVSHHPHRHFLMVSRAHIIGTLDSKHTQKKRDRWIDWIERHMLDQLEQFMLGLFNEYLIMVDKDGVQFDSKNNLYDVKGTDQDNQPAVATIDNQGNITITETTTQGQVDLAPGSLTASSSSVAQGSNLGVTLIVQNLQSGSVTQSFNVDFYLALSANSNGTFNPTTTDTHLGSSSVSGIGGNTSVTVTASLPIPSLGANTNQVVYIYAWVDSAGAITETDKTNNVSTTANAATVLVYDSTNSGRTYKILLQTYAPTGSGSVDTSIGLWVKASSTTATNVASVNASGPPPSGYQQIDTTSTPLPRGTYYALVISWSPNNGPYAFTVRTANITRQTFSTALTSNKQDPNEPADETPQVGSLTAGLTSLPTAPAVMTVGMSVNKYSANSDWDWFTFTLP